MPPQAHITQGYTESGYGYGPAEGYRSPTRQQSPGPYGYRTHEPEMRETVMEEEEREEVGDTFDPETQRRSPSPQRQGGFVGGFWASIRRPFGRLVGGPRSRPHIGTGLPTPPTSPGRTTSPGPQPQSVESMMAQARSQAQQTRTPMRSPTRDVEPLQAPPRLMVPVRQNTAETMDTANTLPRYSVHPPTPTTARREFEEAQERHRAEQEARIREQLHGQQGQSLRPPQLAEVVHRDEDEDDDRHVTYVGVESEADGRSAVHTTWMGSPSPLAPSMAHRELSHNSRGPSEHPAIAEEDEQEDEPVATRSATGSHRGTVRPEGEALPPGATHPSHQGSVLQEVAPEAASPVRQNGLTQSPTPMSPAQSALRSALGSPRVADQLASPEPVEVMPASDYDKMSSAFHTAPSEFSTFGSYWECIQQFWHELVDLPWMSTRVTADYIPGESPRSRYIRYRQRHPQQNLEATGVPPDSWYAPAKGHQALDLLEGGPAPRYEGGYAYGAGPSPSMMVANRFRATPTYPGTYPVSMQPQETSAPPGGYVSSEAHLYRMASNYGSTRSPPRTRHSLARDSVYSSHRGRPRDQELGSPRSGRSDRTITGARSPPQPGGGRGDRGGEQPVSPTGSSTPYVWPGFMENLHRRSRSLFGPLQQPRISWYNYPNGRPTSGASSTRRGTEGQPNMMSMLPSHSAPITQ
jgi:hypothetical protein